MRGVIFLLSICASFGSLQSMNVTLHDATNQYYFSTSLSLDFTLSMAEQAEEKYTFANGTATLTATNANDTAGFVDYVLKVNDTSLPKTSLELTIQMKKSGDSLRRFIEEFTAVVKFDGSNILANHTDAQPLTFIVRPPRFPHFQVKTDWRYRCPVKLDLLLCPVVNGTCVTDRPPYSYVHAKISMTDTLFNGGMEATHDYTDKIEDCPLSYETRTDIGIACIVAFWSIVLAVALWGIIKFLLKRNRKQLD